MANMEDDELRCRIEWQAQEIRRVCAEKEGMINEGLGWRREVERLRGILHEVTVKQSQPQPQPRETPDTAEFERVKTENARLQTREETLLSKIEELEGELWESKKGLERARFALGAVPGPMRRLCFRMLVPKVANGFLVEEGVGKDGDWNGKGSEEKKVEEQMEQREERRTQKQPRTQTGQERQRKRLKRQDKESGSTATQKYEHQRSRSFF